MEKNVEPEQLSINPQIERWDWQKVSASQGTDATVAVSGATCHPFSDIGRIASNTRGPRRTSSDPTEMAEVASWDASRSLRSQVLQETVNAVLMGRGSIRTVLELPFRPAVDVPADFSKMQFLAAGSFTAAPWESSETRVGVSRRRRLATAVQLVKLRRRAAEVVFTDATSGLSQTTAGDASSVSWPVAQLKEVVLTAAT